MDIWNLLQNLAMVFLMVVVLMVTLDQGVDLLRIQVMVFLTVVASSDIKFQSRAIISENH
jgi:hypothetical protein